MNKIIMIAILAPILVATTNAYASGDSPYDSGYNHGCDDAGLSSSDRYINEPGKGPSFHTDEFMSGYHDGFQECGGSSGGESNIIDDAWNTCTNAFGETICRMIAGNVACSLIGIDPVTCETFRRALD
jgi:hypothetical protein